MLRFHPIPNPSQALQFGVTGRRLGMFESLERSPGRGDEDHCYRTAYTRRMWNLDARAVSWHELQGWMQDDLLTAWFEDADE